MIVAHSWIPIFEVAFVGRVGAGGSSNIDVHPSTITKSRNWLSDVEIDVEAENVRSSILGAKLPTIEEITYSEWAERFQKVIIVSKTSALFDTAELKEKTAQLVVAQKTWREELARCAPMTIFEKDDTFSSILCQPNKLPRTTKTHKRPPQDS
ncbi:hypothetical protein CFIMG_007910RA00001 [Ceratocystis fimbriata CBS 114723]|uniref:Uncharacterized protein n=1 Tax=Ceratocystis fimbriata CBS 114723 TaxID=1035309 RepID=A0A2C5WST7_9PEZI|nr:hypothetical protein CFIMG_007910RA00001 [Ceratocystis fimbriata CBS 114723]